MTSERDNGLGETMRLGDVIRAYRMHRECSLRACAKEIGIGAATLMRFEQGQEIDAKTFLLILKWLTGPSWSRLPSRSAVSETL